MIRQDYILHQLADSNRLNEAAADYWITEANQAIEAHGSFYVALTGGSTPRAFYQLLATPDYRSKLDWSRVHVYIGDERFVPDGHPDNNFSMARQNLLNHVGIPEQNLHPVNTGLETADDAATDYAKALQSRVPLSEQGLPIFDLIMLGMGDDGHTASLFPDTAILNQQQKIVDAIYVEKMDSWRVSMTYPCLNNARQVMFLISGEQKAAILKHVLTDGTDQRYPVQQVHAADETHWFIDQAAASQLDFSV